MVKKKKASLLKDLIHSLEPGEKRYVTISLSQFKADSDYLRVFNAILLSGPDSEDRDLSEISDHVAVLKVQLYWKILRLIQLYKSESNPEIKKNDLLSQYVILEEKGLSDQALKVLNRLSDFCREHDFIDDLLYIERKKVRLYTERNDQQKKEHYLSLFKKESLRNIKAITQLNTLLKIYYQNKLNLQFFSLKIDLNAINIINSYINKLEEQELLSENARFFYHFNKCMYYVLTKDIPAGFHHLEITINHVFGAGSHKAFYSLHQSDILDVLSELMHVNEIDSLFKDMIPGIGQKLLKAKGDMKRFGLFKLETECYFNWKQDDIKAFSASYHKLLKYIQEQDYDAYKTSQPVHAVRLFIGNKEYKKCWFFIYNLSRIQSRNLKFEVQVSFKLLGLLLGIRLLDFVLVKTEMKNLRVFIGSTGIDSDFCNSVLLLAESMLRLSRKESRKSKLLAAFYQGLAGILKQEDYQFNYDKIINFNKLIPDAA